jgi:hypothetical protein
MIGENLPAFGVEDDGELLAMLSQERSDAEEYTDTLIGEDRAKAMDYYLRRPMGNERPGRSKVISAEVFKTVEGLTTAISNIFSQSKTPIQFESRKEGGEKHAEERTILCEYIYNKLNNGLEIDTSAIKDGLLLKTGFITWRFEKDTTVKIEKYSGQTQDSLALMQDVPNAEVIEVSPPVQGPEGEVFDVKVKVTDSNGKIIVEALPPEEILVSPRARSFDIEKSPCVIWRRLRSRNELLSAGYDEDLVDSLDFMGANYGSSDGIGGQIYRTNDNLTNSFSEGEALIFKYWIRLDQDGDGVPELRCIEVSDNDVILSNEITDEIPIASWTPNPQPHEFFGRCPADEQIESQDVQTVLVRQTLDNVYFANNPMWRVDPVGGKDAIRQLMNPSIGQVITSPRDALEPVAMPFIAQHSMPMIEYFKADDENKTGFTRYAQGMDAKSLNNTATGVSIITNMSQERVKFMANLYARCKARAIRGIAKLLSQHCEEMKPLTIRLAGEYQTIDPRQWDEEFDMSVNVGLGVVEKDKQIQSRMMIAQAQAQAVQAGGLGKLVTMKNIYNLQTDLAELAGEKSPNKYWTDPETVPPPPPAGPPPEVQKTQMELQADQQKFQAQSSFEMQKHQQSMSLEKYKADLKASLDFEIAQMREQYKQSLDSSRIDALSRPAASINLGGNDVASILQAGNQETQALMAQIAQMQGEGFAQMAEAISQLAQAQMQSALLPKKATLSNGKTVTIQPVMNHEQK